MKKIFVLLCSISLGFSSAAMLEKANKYVELINQVGVNGEINDADFESLIASDCKRVINGKTETGNRDELKDYLTHSKTFYDSWKINLLKVIPHEERNCCTLYYEIIFEEPLRWVVMKVLKFSQGSISQIIEVFNKVQINNQ